MAETKYKDKGLRKLMASMKNVPSGQIGIFSGKNQRSDEGPTNAEIGAAHEYGTVSGGLPSRSFLRVPIAEHLDKRLETSKTLSRAAFMKAVKDGTLLQFVDTLATMAEGIVREAFTTNGFGKWAPTKTQNTTGQILVRTTQLRESITHRVIK